MGATCASGRGNSEGGSGNIGVAAGVDAAASEEAEPMKRVSDMIAELQKFPADALCYAYEGEIIGVVVVTSDGDELGYILAGDYEPARDTDAMDK